MVSKFWAAGLLCAATAWAQPSHQTGIAHVAFRVDDLEAARTFYNRLGFEQFFEMKQGERTSEAFLKINDRQFIELYPRTDPGQALGLMHVCYESDDLAALHAELAVRAWRFRMCGRRARAIC
ncbi:MAG: VOC family protein [Ignavibacteriota bacterium]